MTTTDGKYYVEVDVAYSRPPKHDDTFFFIILAEDGVAAELIACQWAQCNRGVVMAVGSVVTSWPEE